MQRFAIARICGPVMLVVARTKLLNTVQRVYYYCTMQPKDSILSSVTHYFLQFNSVLIIIDLVLVLVLVCLVIVLVLVGLVLGLECLVLGLEGQVLDNITVVVSSTYKLVLEENNTGYFVSILLNCHPRTKGTSISF